MCGEAEDAEVAIEELKSAKPDLAVVDLSLNGRSGLELVHDMKARRPPTAVLVYSMYDETLYAERAIRAGASGYVMKRESIDEVLAAIRQILKGHVYLSPAASTRMVHRAVDGKVACSESALQELATGNWRFFTSWGKGCRRVRSVKSSIEASRRSSRTGRTSRRSSASGRAGNYSGMPSSKVSSSNDVQPRGACRSAASVMDLARRVGTADSGADCGRGRDPVQLGPT